MAARQMRIRDRGRHWRSLLWRPVLKIGGVLYTVLGAVSLARAEFFPRLGEKFAVVNLLPSWPLSTWIIVALALLLVVALEGSYRLAHATGTEHERRTAELEAQLRTRTNRRAVLDKLASLRSDGANLFAEQLPDAARVPVWKDNVRKWREETALLLEVEFSKATRNLFEVLGGFTDRAYPDSANYAHAYERQMLDEQLQRLERIIERESASPS